MEKPRIFGMIQRTGEIMIRMLENVDRVKIGRLIQQTITEGSMVYTDEYDIYARLIESGYDQLVASNCREVETLPSATGSGSRASADRPVRQWT